MSTDQKSSVEDQVSSSNKSAFQRVVRDRRAYRRFLSTPIPHEQIWEVMEDAQFSPSNCNVQPWNMHIVSGQKLLELSEALLAAHEANAISLDFTFSTDDFQGRYKERQFEQGKHYYEALGIKREDREVRVEAVARNYRFFNAPHAALLFMPTIGDNVRAASDVGMYAQTFLLSLAAHGFGGIPQTTLGFYADTVRKVLDVSDEFKLLFGVSFGYPDVHAVENATRLGRDPIEQSVTFHE